MTAKVRYRLSAKGKKTAAMYAATYAASARGKDIRARYAASAAGKEAARKATEKYGKSLRAQKLRAAYGAKYRVTDAYKLSVLKYSKSIKYRQRVAEYTKSEKYLAYQAQYRATPKCKLSGHAQTLRAYGLTPQTYAAILAEQGGRCAIKGCMSQDTRRLVVDHCHETGKIRGLLCHRHNLALGFAGDSLYDLLRLADYLLERG